MKMAEFQILLKAQAATEADRRELAEEAKRHVGYLERARREGLLSLEYAVDREPDRFAAELYGLVVGATPEAELEELVLLRCSRRLGEPKELLRLLMTGLAVRGASSGASPALVARKLDALLGPGLVPVPEEPRRY